MVKQIKLSNNKRLPVIYRNDCDFVPILQPLVYTVLKLKNKAFETITKQLQVIDFLYQYFAENNHDLDELIINGDYHKIFDHLNPFLNLYLHSKAEQKSRNLSRAQLNFKAMAVKSYLVWCLSRHVDSYSDEAKKSRITSCFKTRLSAFFETYTLPGETGKKVYRSLSNQDFTKLLEIIEPKSVNNPFQQTEQTRNYLIFHLLLHTGIRLGELLLLRSSSIKEINSHYYISICQINELDDSRNRPPSIKNRQSERIVSIGEDTYELCQHYIMNNRRPKKNGKKAKLEHGFLLTSELGKPLSQSTIAYIFRKIDGLRNTGIGLSKRISPHVLRHTFCDRFLKFLIEERGVDMERAKDELRSVCGWTTNSNMPLHYAAKYINEKANEHNLERIQSSKKRHAESIKR
ncbi:MAG: site-specific integrase [Sediminibacterium sp.]|nr:site-specific integrase [Sediminibacterium sp.]